jgi:hypothetical protein
MSLFVRVTLVVAFGIIALLVLAVLLKIFLVAAVLAAIIVGVLAIANSIRRRNAGRAVTIIQRP